MTVGGGARNLCAKGNATKGKIILSMQEKLVKARLYKSFLYAVHNNIFHIYSKYRLIHQIRLTPLT
jgi:hypothetical protein